MNEDLKVVIGADASELKEEVNDAKAALQTLGDESNNAKGKISSFFKDGIKDVDGFKDGIQKAGDASNRFLKGTATAVAGVGTAFLALGPATQEYRQEMAKLETAFTTSGASAEVAKETYNGLYRVLGETDQATEAANHLAQLTSDEKELSEWTKVCQGVYATFGASLPIESMTEAANETAKTGQLTGALADALNWAGASEEDFQKKLDECVNAQEREALIRETLSGLYDDAAAGYEKNAAGILAQNEAQAKLTEAMAELGEVSEPIMAMLTQLGAEILAELTPYIKEFAEKHLPTIQEKLSGVGEKIGKVINWIADHWDLISTIGGVIIGIATAISLVSTGLTVYNTVMGITAVVSAPVIGIIAAIVAGIALLAAGIVLAVKHWDEITAAVKNFAEKVGEFFTGLWDSITEWIKGIGESISKWWEDTKQGFSDWWGSVKEGWNEFWGEVGDKIKEGVQNAKDKFQEMKDNISEKVEETKETVKTKFEEIKTNIAEKVENAKQTVSDKYEEIKEKMTTKIEEAKNNVSDRLDKIKKAYDDNGGGITGIVSGFMETVRQTFDAKLSAADQLTGGKFSNIFNTIRDKMNNAFSAVQDSLGKIKDKFNSIMENVKNIVSNAIEKLKGFFNFKWELPKIKLPHFSISGKFSLDPPQIPKISVDWYANGGVFDSPTLFGYGGRIGGLGEDGAEAIVPLEKNTKWLDIIAEKLAAKQGSTPIYLTVDGRVFAETTISTLNDFRRQTGSLPLLI